MKLVIDIPQMLDFDSIPVLLDKYDFYNISPGSLKDICFNFADVSWVTPTGLACIVAMMKYSKAYQYADQYWLRESKHIDIKNYMERVDFYSQFGIERNNMRRHDKSRSICEIKEVTNVDTHKIAQQIVGIINSQINCDQSVIDIIANVVGETLANIIDHSQSKINGYVCAQTYTKNRILEIAIVDCGVGILKSLSGYATYRYLLDDCEAIKVATGKNVTSKPKTNAGEGLYFVKRFINANKGSLLIFSGSGCVKFIKGDTKNFYFPKWQGTIISLQFNLDTPVDMVEIYNSEYPEDAQFDYLPVLDDLFE